MVAFHSLAGVAANGPKTPTMPALLNITSR